jgi:hypothetical protein
VEDHLSGTLFPFFPEIVGQEMWNPSQMKRFEPENFVQESAFITRDFSPSGGMKCSSPISLTRK